MLRVRELRRPVLRPLNGKSNPPVASLILFIALGNDLHRARFSHPDSYPGQKGSKSLQKCISERQSGINMKIWTLVSEGMLVMLRSYSSLPPPRNHRGIWSSVMSKDIVFNKHILRSTWTSPLKTSEEESQSTNRHNLNLATPLYSQKFESYQVFLSTNVILSTVDSDCTVFVTARQYGQQWPHNLTSVCFW